jgi:hypothetical protein
MPVISTTVTSRLDWVDCAIEDPINITKETVKNEQGEDFQRYVATAPGIPELTPRYGADRADAIEALKKVLWEYRASGYDVEKANSVK